MADPAVQRLIEQFELNRRRRIVQEQMRRGRQFTQLYESPRPLRAPRFRFDCSVENIEYDSDDDYVCTDIKRAETFKDIQALCAEPWRGKIDVVGTMCPFEFYFIGGDKEKINWLRNDFGMNVVQISKKGAFDRTTIREINWRDNRNSDKAIFIVKPWKDEREHTKIRYSNYIVKSSSEKSAIYYGPIGEQDRGVFRQHRYEFCLVPLCSKSMSILQRYCPSIDTKDILLDKVMYGMILPKVM